MKNIKLFDINGLDEDRLLKLKGDIIHFFVSSAKYKYDEIHVPDMYQIDDDVLRVINYFDFSGRVIYYNSEKTVFKRMHEETAAIMEKYNTSPKLNITNVGVNEDGALRIVIDVKEQNDPNTFLKVMRGINKVLREHEEEIING